MRTSTPDSTPCCAELSLADSGQIALLHTPIPADFPSPADDYVGQRDATGKCFEAIHDGVE